MKTERFNLALTPADKKMLYLIAEIERIPAAAVVRRLIWDAHSRLTPVAADAVLAPAGDGDGDTHRAAEHDG